MCLKNAIPAKADFRVKKFWKTFYKTEKEVISAVFSIPYKHGWNHCDDSIKDICDKGIHCFDNYEDALAYKKYWNIKDEFVCPVYALGSDIIATGTINNNERRDIPNTTFKKVFIRRKDYEQLLLGKNVHETSN